MSITAVLIDDEQLVRSALAQALSSAGSELIGEAGSGEEGIELVLELRPDVVITGLSLPGISGIETIQRISRLAPATRILVLTHSEHNQVVGAIIAGASGYILKSAAPEDIVSAVRATAAGESVLSSQIAGKLLERIRELDIPVAPTSQAAADTIRAVLTERELEIFTLLASGESNQQIGQRLLLSPHTIANHIKSILAKLQLENRIQAVAHAIRSGIA